MKPSKIAKLKTSLTETMNEWLDKSDLTAELYLYPPNLELLMAEAAMSVLLAAEDMNVALAEGGYLKEEE